jgi:hypothetical protein
VLSDHLREVRAPLVLAAIGNIHAIVDGTLYRLEGNLVRHPRQCDPASLLPQRSLVPARVLPVVGAHIERTVHDNRPDPGIRAVGLPVISKRLDV